MSDPRSPGRRCALLGDDIPAEEQRVLQLPDEAPTAVDPMDAVRELGRLVVGETPLNEVFTRVSEYCGTASPVRPTCR